MTFDDLATLCKERGEPLQMLVRGVDGQYQASLRSCYATNSFACGMGATPTGALRAVTLQRGHLKPVEIEAEDLI